MSEPKEYGCMIIDGRLCMAQGFTKNTHTVIEKHYYDAAQATIDELQKLVSIADILIGQDEVNNPVRQWNEAKAALERVKK